MGCLFVNIIIYLFILNYVAYVNSINFKYRPRLGRLPDSTDHYTVEFG